MGQQTRIQLTIKKLMNEATPYELTQLDQLLAADADKVFFADAITAYFKRQPEYNETDSKLLFNRINAQIGKNTATRKT